MNELVRAEPLAVRPAEPSAGELFAAIVGAIKSGEITADKVAAMDGAMNLCERMAAKESERAFASDFIPLLRDLPTIEGTRPVPAKDGTIKYRYANFDDIDQIVRPICLAHGFTYAFHEREVKDGRVTVVMTLQHERGHKREVPYSVRIGSGPPGANESQADVSGHSYAQRGALESGLALRIVGAREDARLLGRNVTQAQADELRRRVAETGSDEAAFLKFAQSSTFEGIQTGMLPVLDANLKRKESTK